MECKIFIIFKSRKKGYIVKIFVLKFHVNNIRVWENVRVRRLSEKAEKGLRMVAARL